MDAFSNVSAKKRKVFKGNSRMSLGIGSSRQFSWAKITKDSAIYRVEVTPARQDNFTVASRAKHFIN
jgi:hypothetical protein